jgi:hypothetical protein
MQADERAFLEDMLETAERLDWVTCQEETRHTQEAVGSIAGGVTKLVMRCGTCRECRPWLLVK